MSKRLKVYSIDGVTPVVDPSAYVHPSAVLIGDVIVGPGCYIGPCASLRGDFGRLILQEGANVQDTCVIHGFQGADTVVEKNGHIGHGAVLHGCRIGENALIGMNAVIMDNAVVGESSIVAASSFVKAGLIVPPRVLMAGAPARKVRDLSEEEMTGKCIGTAAYHQLTRRCFDSMIQTDALTHVKPDRKRIELDIDELKRSALAIQASRPHG